MGVVAENGGPCSPRATIQKWTRFSVRSQRQLRPGGSNAALRPHHGAWMALIWSADGACVLKAWGEPGGAWWRVQQARACMRAWRESVSAQCTPTQRSCTAWQSMACECRVRAVHKHAVRWRKHNTRHRVSSSEVSPSFSSNWLDARAVHRCSAPQAASCRLQARRLQQQATWLSVLAIRPQQLGHVPPAMGPALLSLTVRKNGPPQ